VSNRPWMPLYIADYLGDTGHLNTIQHGAYILLIMHYWRTGRLPTDDIHLARIAKLSLKFWTDNVKPDIEPLFREGWRHKRIDQELEKQEAIAAKRAAAGRKGGTVTGTNRFVTKEISRALRQANAKQLLPKIEQLPSKRVAVTVTEDKKEAADGAAGKDIARMTRAEFDERLLAKRA
jgi:uncharacterized protein YdaU (DUF1376 family)